MQEGQIARLAAEIRKLGDGQATATRQKCKMVAAFRADPTALTKLADYLEMTRTKLAKWAGHGAMMDLEIAGEDWPIELGYQVSLWPEEDWEQVGDLVSLAGLKALELKAIRKAHTNLADVRRTLRLGHIGLWFADTSDRRLEFREGKEPE